MISLAYLATTLLLACVLPLLLPEELRHTSSVTFAPPLSASASGTAQHLCGSDNNGNDLFYRLLTGAQVSLGIGIIGAVLSLIIGTAYGMVAGYVGGSVDALMMRFIDVLYSVPRLLFIMVFIGAFDDRIRHTLDVARLWGQSHHWGSVEGLMGLLLPYSRILIMVVSLGLIEWLTMARIIRGQVLALREQAFITASRAMGQSARVILWRHLLPNLSTVILTYLTLTIPAVILDESFLSFLGLGIDDPAASWGSLLKDGAQVINPIESKWWLLVFPATLMSLTLLALNFLGDGLRDAFDPRSAT
jgi:peptide/nickel transport system permease protein/oligopeptide transport system permease protein